ncbi:MAG: SH3 domain-containing protein [Pseudonocardiaceae bacterium]
MQLFVTQPYLELHTGPGRGFPVTQVVARGESVDVLFRRTDWFKVRTERGIEGWASVHDLSQTQMADGSPFAVDTGTLSGFRTHAWEGGVFAGAYAGATLISAYAALSVTDNLKIEADLSQFLGNVSNGYLIDVGLAHVFVPQWRVSPFVTLGAGITRTEPKATFVQPIDRDDQLAYAGGGLRLYLTRRFFLRGEYRTDLVITKTNSYEVNPEWRFGFGFFY